MNASQENALLSAYSMLEDLKPMLKPEFFAEIGTINEILEELENEFTSIEFK